LNTTIDNDIECGTRLTARGDLRVGEGRGHADAVAPEPTLESGQHNK
jgi:hypothetical protein